MRSATMNGSWYGRLMVPVPRPMRLVSAEALAMKMSGAGMFSYAPVWCSPTHTSS